MRSTFCLTSDKCTANLKPLNLASSKTGMNVLASPFFQIEYKKEIVKHKLKKMKSFSHLSFII